MKKAKSTEIPGGWTNTTHREIETYGIGEGFVLFEETGETLRGILRTFFPTRHGKAVAIELTEVTTASVYKTAENGGREQLDPKSGELVNLSLSSIDLERKLSAEHRDEEVGIQYTHNVGTKAGQMKVYRVVVFQSELPF